MTEPISALYTPLGAQKLYLSRRNPPFCRSFFCGYSFIFLSSHGNDFFFYCIAEAKYIQSRIKLGCQYSHPSKSNTLNYICYIKILSPFHLILKHLVCTTKKGSRTYIQYATWFTINRVQLLRETPSIFIMNVMNSIYF